MRDEDLMKNIFTGIGYFVAVGAMARAFNCGKEIGAMFSILFILFVLLLLLLSILFISIHVVRPIVRLSWPDFSIPGIDEGARKFPIKEYLLRWDIWLFLFLVSLSIFSGVQLAGIFGNPSQC